MATFCKLLSERGRVNFWKLCQEFGVNPDQAKRDEQKIQVQGKMESLEEIAQMMQQPPNYSVDAQEREG